MSQYLFSFKTCKKKSKKKNGRNGIRTGNLLVKSYRALYRLSYRNRMQWFVECKEIQFLNLSVKFKVK